MFKKTRQQNLRKSFKINGIKSKSPMSTLKVSCDDAGIEKANKIIRDGGVMVFPTDTVYGIGCDPFNKKAVEKIYRIKSRESVKSVPVLTNSATAAKKICHIDKFTEKIIEKFWPGPLTIILKLTDESLKESLNLKERIAIRVPNHECTLKILEKCNFLVGTSANVSGRAPYTDPDECFRNLHGYDIFLDGGTITSEAVSTIIEIENEEIKIVREGCLTKEEIMI